MPVNLPPSCPGPRGAGAGGRSAPWEGLQAAHDHRHVHVGQRPGVGLAGAAPPRLKHRGDAAQRQAHGRYRQLAVDAELVDRPVGEVAQGPGVATALPVPLAGRTAALGGQSDEGRAPGGLGGQGPFHQRPQHALQGGAPLHRRAELAVEQGRLTLVESRKQVLAVGEVLVDQSPADAGPGGNGLHGHFVGVPPGHDLGGGVQQDLPSGRAGARLGVAGGGRCGQGGGGGSGHEALWPPGSDKLSRGHFRGNSMTYAGGRAILDADSHVMELADFLDEHIEPSARDRLRRRGMEALGLGFEGQLVFATFATAMFSLRRNLHRYTDPDELAADLDLLYAGCRAQNKAMNAFCAEDRRLLPVAYVSLVDPARAVDVAAEAIDGGASAVMVPSTAAGERSPTHPDLNPFWALLQERDIPFVLHVGGGGRLLDRAFHNNAMPVTDHLGGGENIRSKDYL